METTEKSVEDMTRSLQMVILESSRNEFKAAEEIASLKGKLAEALERNVGLRQQIGARDEYINTQQNKIEAMGEASSSMREEISRLKCEVEAGDKDEKELYACRDRCLILEKAAEEYRKDWDASQAEVRRLDKKIVDLEAENRRLKDMRQQWLDRDRDNQIVIQTLKDVISDLR